GTVYDITQGILYAAGLTNDAGVLPAQAADVLNMSFGGSEYSQTEADVIQQAIQVQGKILVAAAGNESTSILIYPGAYDGVITVSAVDINREFAGYSNYGSSIDVAAPGGNGYTDYDGDGHIDGILNVCGNDSSGSIKYTYCFMVGSSMACAHVSGVAALMKAVYPAMTPAEFSTFLMSGWITDDLGDAGRDDHYGYGLIDAYRAVLQAKAIAEGGSLPTLLGVTPASVNLSIATNTASLTALKWGDGALSITGVTDDAAWITVTADQVDADGLGTYTMVVDRTSLSPGSHPAEVTFASSENDVVVDVNVQVTSIDTTSNAGLHHVFLVDYDTLETRTQEVAVSNGTYTYAFADIPAGRYQIYAGTNLDNDMFVGDEGEAFGAYLSSDFPVVITLGGSDLPDLDFMTGFSTTLEGNSVTSIGQAKLELKD
ncbi:MAG: S8 family serine peptidase, partial [Planctomycetota bacterium]